jgi:hypothetical protein
MRIALVLIGLIAFVSPASAQAMFRTEAAAQNHCLGDTVVWLDIAAGVYYPHGSPAYGTAGNGGYVCRHDATAAGDREAPSSGK